jgi:ATP-dependent DNA ligase
LDGEVVALDSEGRQNFRDLRAGRGNLHYAAFDAFWIEGKDLRPLLLTRRKRALTSLIPATTTVLSQVFSIEERGRDMFAAAERLDLEGIVAKRKADAYRPETVWYKIKSRTYTQGEVSRLSAGREHTCGYGHAGHLLLGNGEAEGTEVDGFTAVPVRVEGQP